MTKRAGTEETAAKEVVKAQEPEDLTVLKIADVNVGITGFPGRKTILEHYIAEGVEPEFVLRTEDYPRKDYWLTLHRALSEALVPYDILLFHASAISFSGQGFAYTAPSGTGKSTHARLVKETFGDRVEYVNDDKPFLVFREGRVFITGSPWSGKHRLENALTVPLKGITFLSQAKENRIEFVDPMTAYTELLKQVYRPESKELLERTLGLLETVVKTVPCYRMGCTISEEAARLSVETMNGARHDA